MQAMTDLVAPHLKPGSAGRKALDQFGLFNVNQVAILIPPHKFGVQVNIVKPDIHPHTGNYYLQVFPIHNELGFNLLDTFIASRLQEYLPDWCGLGAQIIFNHGVEFPIVHTGQGWKLLGPNDPDGATLTEELVCRPSELALQYLAATYPGVPVQATFGLEVGIHFKWALSNPNAKWAFASTCAGNAIGAAAGLTAAWIGGGDPVLMTHGGAMVGQVVTHGLQCWSDALCPDKIAAWAGTTLSAADVNAKHFMEYPRLYWHGREGCVDPRNLKQTLKQQTEDAISKYFKSRQRSNAIDAAEKGISMAGMGIDPTTVSTQTPPPTISERYAAQSPLSCYGRFRADL